MEVSALLAFASMIGPADDAPPSADNSDSLLRTAKIMAVSGAIVTVLGLYLAVDGQGLLDRERAATRRAHALWQEATEAARNRDCERVRALAAEIRDIDRDVYNLVFSPPAVAATCMPGSSTFGSAPVSPPVSPPVAPAVAPPPPRDRTKDREQAFALTRVAREAAHSGDCARAIELQAQVRELDLNVHDAWFVRDPAIGACLAPAPPPPVEAEPQP
jgi:hypothetical protein